MNNIYIKNGLRFILLTLLQVFVFDKLSLYGFLIPYVYVGFILLLPYDTGKTWLLLSAFFAGLMIDVFGNTLGLHAAAATFMAFARPSVIRLYFPKMEFVEKQQPGIKKLGISGFIKYAFTLIVMHHFVLVYLEIFTLHNFFERLGQVLLNSIYTLFILLILVLLFPERTK